MPAWDREKPQTELTRPHRRMHSLLVTMGFEVEDEVPVGKYRLDCLVREVWCAFECDGKQVHAGTKKQQRDRDRDRWIYEHAGIPVMRIEADALQWQLWEDLKPLIYEFINDHAMTIEQRRLIAGDNGLLV